MIRLFTGVPRSGKTYLAVYEILQLLDTEENLIVLTNIEGLKVDDARLVVMEFHNLFFQNTHIAPFLRDLRDKHGLQQGDKIHIFIDEAQRYFRKPDTDTIYFFDYHGHYGCDVTIITQHEKKIAFDIACHHEEEYRASATTTNPFSSFVYKKRQAGEQFGTKRLKREKRVFDAYTSFQAGNPKIQKSKAPAYALGIVVFAVLMWILFFKVFAKSFGLGGDSPQPEALTQNQPVKPPVRPSSVVSDQPTPPAPVQHVKSDTPEIATKFMGPEILDYSSSRDALQITVGANDLPAWVDVRQYIADYTPEVYGYGYFHAPGKRFVLFSAANGELIFPVKNPIFVRAEPAPENITATTITLEPRYGSNPTLIDRHGYTEQDRLYARYAQLLAAGFNVESPKVPQFNGENNSTF